MGGLPKALSVSFHSGDGCLEHNNRIFFTDNVDQTRTPDNIIYIQRDLREVYHELFDAALADYNSEQTRKDRVIEDYYEHIKRGKKEKLFQEVIVMFGNKDTCGLNSENWELAKQMLDEYMRDFQKRNPQLIVFNAVLHADEACPHLHINFVPVCYGQKQGLSTRVSMKRALQQMGFSARGRKQTEAILWGQAERKVLTDVLNSHEIYRFVVGAKDERTLKEYKEYQSTIQRLNNQISILKKENPANLTSIEVGEIINQNEYLQSVIERQREEMSSLKIRANADFIPIDFYNDEKRQYIISCLTNSRIPFVEENYSIYVPNCFEQVVKKYAAAFKPQNNQTIRERLKFYIDRLIYSADSLDKLLDLLKQNGYEVKNGKYIAVKPPYAKRFMRLRSLGEDYTDAALKQRIERREDIPAEFVRLEQSYANEAQKPFYTAINGTIRLVRTLQIVPTRTDKSHPYSFDNDAKINTLVDNLNTLSKYGITSREQLYKLSEALQEQIENCTDNDTLFDLKTQFARVASVIRTYEEIIEGNFIDNLIRAERERIAAEQKAAEQRKAASEQETKQTVSSNNTPTTNAQQTNTAPTVNRKKHHR